LKVGLVVSIVVTVLSLTALVILYTYQSDLQAAEETAVERAQRANQERQDLQRQFQDFARDVAGMPNAEPAELQQEIDNAMQSVMADETLSQAIQPDAPVLMAMNQLYTQYDDLRQRLGNLSADFQQLQNDLAEAEASLQEARSDFNEQASRFAERIQELEQANAEDRDQWSTSLENLREEQTTAARRASEQLTEQRETTKELRERVGKQEDRIESLASTLASFRPTADRVSVLQIKDGTVVRSVAGEDIVYISLGEKDNIRPGMTFSVYSRVRGIPADGEGKATIRVVDVFETTSQCDVTSKTRGDPIIEGDIIANPVYDRNRQLTFVVAGDFDLDYDGNIEDPGGEQVARLIEDLGGTVADEVDTTTDFVVLGEIPEPPLIEEEGEAAEDEAAISESQQAGLDRFEEIVTEARALNAAVLNRTQFLQFLGFRVPSE
jgi:hypothetical protein